MSQTKFGQIDKILLFGGSERALHLIETIGSSLKIEVVTAPRLADETPPGFHNPFIEELSARGVEFQVINSLSDCDLASKVTETTLGISLGSPFIFRQEHIAKFKGRLINGHGNRMPTYRGGGGFSWQILQGVELGYHVFHLVETGLDTGAIVFSDEFSFSHNSRTPNDFRKEFTETEKKFFREFIDKVLAGEEFQQIDQQEYFSTYFPRLSTLHHGFIDWSWSALEIERFICAFDDPFAGASTFLNGRRVFLKGARSSRADGDFHPFMSGLIFRKSSKFLYVAAKGGCLILEELLNEDGQDIKSSTILGSRLHTPSAELDSAKEFKAIYTPKGLKEYE